MALTYYGVGRRKESVARVRLFPGTGNIVINDKPLEEYFPKAAQQYTVKQPLVLSNLLEKFDVTAKVLGGGFTGQSGAIRLGIARALIAAYGELKPTLKKDKLLTRDPRMKERKKYGLKKARRAPQFSKR